MFNSIDSNTQYLAVLGNPISHSLSPGLHNFSLQKLEYNIFYMPIRVFATELKRVLRGMGKNYFLGVNLTIPLKTIACSHVDFVDPEAVKIGAINTIKFIKGRSEGYNTDVQAFYDSVCYHFGFKPKGKNVLIFGSGGSARACAYILSQKGVKTIFICSRNKERARSLIQSLEKWSPQVNFCWLDFNKKIISKNFFNTDLMVNTTPLRINELEPAENFFNKFPVEWKRIENSIQFFDLNYYRKMPPEIFEIGKLKIHFCDGWEMLVRQAAGSLNIWLEITNSLESMKNAFPERKFSVR